MIVRLAIVAEISARMTALRLKGIWRITPSAPIRPTALSSERTGDQVHRLVDFCLTSCRQAFFSDVKRLARRRTQFPARLIATLAAGLFLICPGDGHRNWTVG